MAGRRVLVTRTREQASVLAEALHALGAEVLAVPTIRMEPPASYAVLDAALDSLALYDVLLVTSANTARVLAARRAAPWPDQPWTAVIGPATAQAMRDAGLRVDGEPLPSVAESLVRELAPGAAGKRVLLPRAAVARELLPDALRTAGAQVDVVEAYRTVPAEESRALLASWFGPGAERDERIDAVLFTSSSTVENLFTLLGPEMACHALRKTKACSIGPITSETLRRLGVEPAAEAEQHDVPGLLLAVRQLLA